MKTIRTLVLAAIATLGLIGCSKKDEYEKDANALIAELQSETAAMTFEEKIDYARLVVHTSTFHHGSNDEEWAKSDDHALAAVYAGRHGGHRINFRCSQRAHVLGSILSRALGLQWRIANIYSDQFDSLQGHTLAEVLNPTTDKWVAVDADYNIYWQDLNGNRIGMAEVAMSAFTDVVPCSELGCDWNMVSSQENSAAKFLRDSNFLSVVQYFYQKEIVVNGARFDLNKRFDDRGNKTFLEIFSSERIEVR